MSDQVQVSVSVPAQAKALGDALVLVVADIKAKKSIAAIVADSLPALLVAVENYSELQAELQDPQLLVYAGLLGGEILQALKAAPAATT